MTRGAEIEVRGGANPEEIAVILALLTHSAAVEPTPLQRWRATRRAAAGVRLSQRLTVPDGREVR